MNQFLSLKSVAKLTNLLGATNTFLIEGQPGIGKSAILAGLPNKKFRIDAARMTDSADLLFPFADMEEKSLRFMLVGTLAELKDELDAGRPVTIMIDEMGKAPRILMNALSTLLVDRYIDQYHLPKGSIVFATTNLATDGVGDNIPNHLYNRMTTIKCMGPSHDDWMLYAQEKGLNPVLIAWAHENPSAFDTYASPRTGVDPKDNIFSYNPMRTDTSKHFCSPRSLEMASTLLDARTELAPEEFSAALAGTIGAGAGASLQTFVNFADSLPRIKDILANPETCRVPTGVASLVSAAILATRIDKDNHDALLTYIMRFETDEPKALFGQLAVRKPGAIGYLATSRKYQEMTARTYTQARL